MKVLSIVGLALIGSMAASASGQSIDWSTVTLSGTFPTFTFNDPQLGTVTLNYSNDSEFFGLNPATFPEATLMLGNTSGEQLVMSWTTAVQTLDVKIWDIDSAVPGTSDESVMFSSPAANISPAILHASDVWISGTNTLMSDGNITPNGTPGNFSIINFQDPTPFNSITYDWTISNSSSGFIGILGIGAWGNCKRSPNPPASLFGRCSALASQASATTARDVRNSVSIRVTTRPRFSGL